jgi:hypothetical protein
MSVGDEDITSPPATARGSRPTALRASFAADRDAPLPSLASPDAASTGVVSPGAGGALSTTIRERRLNASQRGRRDQLEATLRELSNTQRHKLNSASPSPEFAHARHHRRGAQTPPAGIYIRSPTAPVNQWPAAAPSPLALSVRVPSVPEDVDVHDDVDYLIILRKRILFLVIIVIGILLTLAAVIYCSVSYSPRNAAAIIVAAIPTLIVTYFTTELRAEFNKPQREFVFARRRLLTQWCGRKEEIIVCRFSELGEPYASVDELKARKNTQSLKCHVFLPVPGAENGRIPIIVKKYENQSDKRVAIESWKKYIYGLREMEVGRAAPF